MADGYMGRLAPSPTGALHLGNARTFLITWLRCRSLGGRLIMRMEDLDHPRVKSHTVRQVYEDLRWLGIDWDEGPPGSSPLGGKKSEHEKYIQSNRRTRYQELFEQLYRSGVVYPCKCTRRDIESIRSAPHEGDEMCYPNLCRPDKDGENWEVVGDRPLAWRFAVESGETAFLDGFYGEHTSCLEAWSGDFLVGRSVELVSHKSGQDAPDIDASYQLAVVIDDYEMGISEVIRAEDLLLSTHRQLALYDAFDWEEPSFLHVPLVVGPDGLRLAKRHGDTRIGAIREVGTSPERVLGWLAYSCGWADEGEELSAMDLLKRFDMGRIPKERIVVDDKVKSYLGAF